MPDKYLSTNPLDKLPYKPTLKEIDAWRERRQTYMGGIGGMGMGGMGGFFSRIGELRFRSKTD